MSDQILLLVVGALIGSYFGHVFQKKSWLYQKRIESFSRLIEVLHQQREKAAAYAFSDKLSQQEKSALIEQDFLPVWTQYYLTSFMLSEKGNAEVRNILAGFESRLRNFPEHFAPQSNEYLGFHHEVKRLHSFLQLEIGATAFAKLVWYTRLQRDRQKFEIWAKTEWPKQSEKLINDIFANARGSQQAKQP
jgi:hypothetical protein